MSEWRHLGVHEVAHAGDALSRGLHLLEGIGPFDEPVAVWWRVARPALVLGRGSPVGADEAACDAAGVEVVRRASGGGPVLWNADLLALDVVIPHGHERHRDDVAASYEWLGRAIARALRRLDLDAEALDDERARSENDPTLARLACFAGRSPWEVVVGGRKVAGLSQVRRRAGILLQAGLPLRLDPGALGPLLAIDDAQRALLREALAGTANDLVRLGLAEADRVRAAIDAEIA